MIKLRALWWYYIKMNRKALCFFPNLVQSSDYVNRIVSTDEMLD